MEITGRSIFIIVRICGAELEVYEPLEEDKSQYPFWQ